jgi:cytochrome o ubiquinol oxidase subunit 1
MSLTEDVFGRLTLNAFKHDLIEMGAGLGMFVAAIGVIGLLTYFKRWKWLWHEWLTSVDHKKIGIMYLVVSFLMLFKGLVDAGMLRAQQVLSVGESHGYITASHFQQVFTAHGTTMIFFVGMGVVFGLMNLIVPLQIGARDVAYPFLNSLSFYLFVVGAVLVNLSLVVGNFSGAGWLAYPPLSGIEYNPGVGIDYWAWVLQISGVGTLLSGINFLVTILMMRCPGMSLMKMPLFVWASLATVVLVVFAFPILTATIGMLSFDRLIGTHIFTSDRGGNPMMFINLIWAWGHPEVYILILPAFGIFSEVVATFSRKKLFGYASMVWAIGAITVLSFIVWLHHFFTMGAGANVNAFFGIMTILIAIPTGAKIFNWLFTKFHGQVSFTTPMLWFLGFVIAFTTGGMTGVLMSIPPVDFQVHNSLFLIAHFHSMILPGVLFGVFAGFTYWFPKIMGFVLDEKIGRWAVGCWVFGFLVAFLPLYILGLMGATRRLDHYDAATGWQPLFIVAAFGVGIIAVGMTLQAWQVIVSIKKRKSSWKEAGDPWDGRTLEWMTASPPPFYNFAVIPEVTCRDPFWEMKKEKHHKKPKYEAIHMPKNTAIGLYIGVLSFLFGFAMTWYMFWLAILSLIGIVVCMVVRLSDEEPEYTISAEEMEKMESKPSNRYVW